MAIACGGIITGNQLSVDGVAKLAVNVINAVDGGVRESWSLSLCVD
jgi:hypothetical protein